MRVLVIDDDAVVRVMLSLELPDVTLLEASRLHEGYEVAVAQRPDAIVVDRRLPDGDGLDLVRRLRRATPTQRTPILVITAGFDEADRAEVVQAGADMFLGKPVEAAELVSQVERLLSLAPPDRRPRRQAVLAKLRRGQEVAPDEGIPAPPAPPPVKSRWWGRRRRSG